METGGRILRQGDEMSAHPNYRHEREAIDWARAILAKPERYVILDTETTGVTNSDEVVQIGVISPTGEVLFDTLIKPCKRKYISREATAIHKISMAMLRDQPTYREASTFLQKVLRGKTVITYNAEFDLRLLSQTATFAGGFAPDGRQWQCAMLKYAQFVGEWDDYRNKYRWHRLSGGDHSAIGDCHATLAHIQRMAGGRKRKYSYELWVTAEETVDGRETVQPPARPKRESGSRTPPFGIRISLDGKAELFGYPPQQPTQPEKIELSDGYSRILNAYEQTCGAKVASVLDVVRFLASSYRDMMPEHMEEASHHVTDSRLNGNHSLGSRAVKCFPLIKQMESATIDNIFLIAGGLQTSITQITQSLPYGDQQTRSEAEELESVVRECAKNELFFRVQVLWTDEWAKVRDAIVGSAKKSERKKALGEFVKVIKATGDARSFRGLKEERDRFIEFVKAQAE